MPPSEGAGIQEKSLRKSRPPEKPIEEKIPENQLPGDRVKPSPELLSAMLQGPSIFVKTIQIEGNTVFSDKTLSRTLGRGMR